MNEQTKKKIAVLERALLIAAGCLSQAGYSTDGGDSPETIARFFLRMARRELKEESAYITVEAIKKHPRALC